jgi:hypothetical protein
VIRAWSKAQKGKLKAEMLDFGHCGLFIDHLAQHDGNAQPATRRSATELVVQPPYFADYQLASLPAEVGSLTALQGLALDHNQLASLPAEVGSLAVL